MSQPDTCFEASILSSQHEMQDKTSMDSSTFPVAFLRRLGSSDEHKCICLNKDEVSIGRAKENHYVITDLLVSRKHVVFRQKNGLWTVESMGMNGVALNHIDLPKGQRIPLNHMDTVGFGGNKFVYAFRLQSIEVRDEPLTKKMRLPLATRNYPSIKEAPEAFHSWVRSKKTLERTLAEESDSLDVKLEQKNSLKTKLMLEKDKLDEYLENVKMELELKFNEEKKKLEDKVARGEMEKNELQREKEVLEERISISFQELKVNCARKAEEFEESMAKLNMEKQSLIEQKEFVVEQLTREKNILQERLEEESRLRTETMNELAHIKESHQSLEKEFEEARRKMEEEMKQHQQKDSEDEDRFRRMQDELAEREAQLAAKEKEISEIQSQSAIGLEMYEAIQLLQHGQITDNVGNVMIIVDEGQATNQPNLTELEKVREELRVQKELNEMQLKEASSQARTDIVGRIESIMESELQCGICSELMVFATSLNCMHTFCQYCVDQWKKNKVECPVCRAPITREGRNLIIDNMIDAMVSSLSEEIKNGRKKLLEQRRELAKHQSTESIAPDLIQLPNSSVRGFLRQSERSIPGRNRGRGRAGHIAPPPPRPASMTPITVDSHGPARPRLSANVVRPTRPISPAVRAAQPHPQLAGPHSSIFSTNEDVVIISSGSESTSEETVGSGNELSGAYGNRRQSRRRRSICQRCGRSKRINSRCDGCAL